jgi:hypothetical protein
MKTLVTAATILLLIGGNAMAEKLDFEADAVGQSPAGWIVTKTGRGEPTWTVEENASAASKSKLVKQSGRASYPLLLKSGTAIKDGFVEVRFKPISGLQDRAGGIVWRATDADNYYVVRANALEDNVVLYKTVSGTRSPLDIVGRKGGYGVRVPVATNQWHMLRVDFAGSRFKVTYDGRQVFDVEDATFAGPGMVGLWTKADSVTEFDEFAYAKEDS